MSLTNVGGRGHGAQVALTTSQVLYSEFKAVYLGSIFEERGFFYLQAISTLGNMYKQIIMEQLIGTSSNVN